jgi:hypothetical protein
MEAGNWELCLIVCGITPWAPILDCFVTVTHRRCRPTVDETLWISLLPLPEGESDSSPGWNPGFEVHPLNSVL